MLHLVYESKETDKAYLSTRDPVTGWPGTAPSDRHDPSGSRPVPAFPTPGEERVWLYGDSFVYANEVDDADAWGNQLSLKLNRRVANFGIPGYGTDQAYLRFKNTANDRAGVVGEPSPLPKALI